MVPDRDRPLVVVTAARSAIIVAAAYGGHYRLPVELLLIALFSALLISVIGWSETRTLLFFLFAAAQDRSGE